MDWLVAQGRTVRIRGGLPAAPHAPSQGRFPFAHSFLSPQSKQRRGIFPSTWPRPALLITEPRQPQGWGTSQPAPRASQNRNRDCKSGKCFAELKPELLSLGWWYEECFLPPKAPAVARNDPTKAGVTEVGTEVPTAGLYENFTLPVLRS